ncbi:MAG: DUF3667 domain-containing protein [Gammaproteobacteria bacterium]|nr:DUF3667 domain-containing protein [Gammaproteobacteria bacterium]
MDVSAAQCDNCYTALHGAFCHQCGQEKKSYIRNVSGVVTEFFGEFSNWDTRVWRTLVPLWFRPGFLSRRYVDGHRVPYVPPLRLYLFTSIIAFLFFAKLLPEPTITPAPTASEASMNGADGKKIMSDVFDEINQELQQQELDAELESQFTFLPEQAQQQFDAKVAAIVANPKLAINKFFSLAPQMMFLLLPLFALLLKLLYIRSSRYYMEHLIVALHSHSFILQFSVLYLALQMASQHISWPWLVTFTDWLATATLIWIPTYLLLCQKSYYQQPWGKTLLKFWLTSSVYYLLFTSALIGVIILSILWA